MSDIDVCIELPGEGRPTIVGTLRIINARGKERVAFEYGAEWLKHPKRFALEPGLPLVPGPQFPPQNKSLHNVFSDCAPDRWGRYLVVRREKYQAQKDGRGARQLFESDYLLGIHDVVRMGALRFRRDGDTGNGSYLATGENSVPPMARSIVTWKLQMGSPSTVPAPTTTCASCGVGWCLISWFQTPMIICVTMVFCAMRLAGYYHRPMI